VGQGTDDQAPFRPSPRLARLILPALFTGVGKADRVRLIMVIGVALIREAHLLKLLLATPDRLQPPLQFLR
jgi:hypothetical protein